MDDCLARLPADFLQQLKAILPLGKEAEVLESFCRKRPTTFRANTLKLSVESLKQQLDKLKINYQQVEWLENAFILNQSQESLQETDLYKNGLIYLQSLSSMIPPLVLDPQKEEKILDLTAAPGSKTTQLSALMENSGEIVANDTSRPRLYRLEANCKLLGVTNVTITQLPGQILWQKFPEHFEKALVDAPCSMEGRFYCQDEKTYRDWTIKKVKELAPRQAFLLRSAISATKVGGTIIYSTCTLSPQENEGVIDWILEKEKGNILLEDINIDLPEAMPGLLEFANKKYNPFISKTLRILPSKTMEGFFIAKIKKIKSNL